MSKRRKGKNRSSVAKHRIYEQVRRRLRGQITEQYKGSWHPRTIYPLMRKLSEKGMIRDVGSARVGKVYARQFLPAISRPEYMALRIMETLPEAELPQFLSYFSY